MTICTFRRADVFREDALAQYVIAQIHRTAREFAFALPAYCVMPDHAHLLAEGRSPSSDLRRFMKRLKQRTGQHYAAAAGRQLWQEGYYDHVLRPEEPEAVIARYIIENPVRAGLVNTAADYPYSGSDRWSIEEIVKTVL